MKKKEIAATVAKLEAAGLTKPGVRLVAARFADEFAAKSDTFDKAGFMLACGVEAPKQ